MASEETEEVDFREFDILAAVKEAGVKTICLDEAHHLRSEWWKALEAFMKEMKGMTVIALTATPPYDSTPGTVEAATRTCAVRSMRRSLRRNWCGKEASVRMRTTSVSTGRPRRN